MALNKIRNQAAFHRAAKRDVRRTSELHEDALESGDEVALSILRMSIEELTQAMPVSNQRIIRLRIEGHDLESIASRVGRSKRTVERVLQDFRSRLMKTLNNGSEANGPSEG